VLLEKALQFLAAVIEGKPVPELNDSILKHIYGKFILYVRVDKQRHNGDEINDGRLAINIDGSGLTVLCT